MRSDRLRAARMLVRVEEGAYSSRLLGRVDAPGVRVRVLGVLRWQRALDAVLEPLCRRRFDRLDAEVRAALRIGFFEATHLDVPAQVATDRAVHLVGALGKGSAKGVVNAVLRRAVADPGRGLDGAPPDLRLSHPEWLARRWVEHLGAHAAEAIMASNQVPAPTWVWFLDPQARDRLDAAGVDLRAHPWCPGAWSAPAGSRELVMAVEEGEAYAQDPSSQLVSHVAANLATDGSRLADLCAAPGGKVALLLSLREWRVAVALDRHPTRAHLVRRLVNRLGGGATVVIGDATRSPLERRSWDVVLVDAPCTGTGTLRRHPDLRWRLTPAVLKTLVSIQQDLLAAGLELVAPGGVLLYSTCSIEPEENEGLLERTAPAASTYDLGGLVPNGTPSRRTTAGGVRILPSSDADGFTLHALRGSG